MNRFVLATLLVTVIWSGTLFAQKEKSQTEKLREIITEAEGFVTFGWPQVIKKNELFENKVRVLFSEPKAQTSFDFFRNRFYDMPLLQEKIIKQLKQKCDSFPEGIAFMNLCQDTEFITLVTCDFENGFFADEKQPDTTFLVVKDKAGYRHKVRLTDFTLRDVFKLYCFVAFNDLNAADDADLLVDLAFFARALGQVDEAKNILENNIEKQKKPLTEDQNGKVKFLKDYILEKDGVRNGALPEEMVQLGGYAMDKFEYTDHARREKREPMTNVSWFEAKLLCERQGKRLCTGGEWVEACRGKDEILWPYGKVLDLDACNTAKYKQVGEEKVFQPGNPARVGSFPKCVTASGIYDMSGNVWEWTSGSAPETPNPKQRLAFGGSMYSTPDNAKCTNFTPYDMRVRYLTVGFRCCYGPEKKGIYDGVKPPESQVEEKPIVKVEEKPAEKIEEKQPEEKAPEEKKEAPAKEETVKEPSAAAKASPQDEKKK